MELFIGRPENTEGRLPREIRTYDFLDKLGIEYYRTDHEPANTMEACNKIDAVLKEDKEKYINEFKKLSDDVFPISAVTKEGVDDLLYFVESKVDEIPKPEFDLDIEEDLGAYDNDDSSFEIVKAGKDAYLVTGGKINRLAKVTDIRNTEQVVRLQNIMKSMGVFDELHKVGLKNGDTLIVGHLELGYYDDEVWGETDCKL